MVGGGGVVKTLIPYETKKQHYKYEGCRQLIGIACLAATMCMFFNLNVLGLLTQVYYIQSYLHVT